MTDTARNKAVIREFWAATQDEKPAYLVDDPIWHLPTSVARAFPAQDLRGDQVRTLFTASTGVYEPERTWEIHHVVAEDDLVTLHCTMHGRTRAGHDYHGSYHMLFRLEDERIAEAWEFLDTAYVRECMTPA